MTAISPAFRKKLLEERDAARTDSRLRARSARPFTYRSLDPQQTYRVKARNAHGVGSQSNFACVDK